MSEDSFSEQTGDAAGAMAAFQRAADLGHERARAIVAARRCDG
ncbi:hypothetical protein DSCO28_53250 [Desulfosarcina ovata subsp. sediminis]|uniref:Sel1 repeat family protein n=1 Tax=Desulfosarcina ovata subsp. sediminis TaxID=885957 RepID=A0A5K7ZWX3_9BACT|nr:hypothetical protein [Desulfosarcina ovata]BBO84759.1 hypothetical protein DSCO28_53250 [Desulfosarcina ovata subsp. sediminis]